ncbi:MAG: hypothetical protein KGZ86_03205 [Candidatus Latescibacteria bacterium]|nr:hypothetical protein [Candidatus Latescibacterota bacterium]
MLKIDIVKTKKDWQDFIGLPWTIYKDNQYWIPPLKSEVKEILNTEKNPFWEHARREMFLVRDDKKTVGRIVAIIDDNHNQFHEDNIGFFGFYESINDFEVAKLLYDSAKKWLQDNKKDAMRGPLNPSQNDEIGFLLEGFDKPPVVMMTYTPPYYLDLSERYGFKKAKDLYALLKNAREPVPERIERMVEIIRKKSRVKVRTVDMKHFNRDLRHLKDIYNAAWEKNWGFVPMTDKEIDLTAKKIKQFIDPGLVVFAEVDDKPVGVVVTIPDINQVLKRLNGKLGLIEMVKFLYYRRKIDGTRALIGGIKKEFRQSGIISLLFYESIKHAQKHGYKWCEFGWNLEDNDLINQFDMAIGGKIYKKYRIYEMKI